MIIDLHIAAPPEGTEYGERPVVVAARIDCPDCGRQHEHEVCPRCRSDIGISFGLGGGPGFGEWKYCLEEHGDCAWTWKRALPSEEE